MEDERSLVWLKTEIKEETPGDGSTATDQFGPYKEHSHNEVISEEYCNPFLFNNSKKTKFCPSNLEEFEKSKLMKIEKPGCSETLLLKQDIDRTRYLNEEQKVKKEVFDYEDLHHSIDIKEEDERTGCCEADSDMQGDINAQGNPLRSEDPKYLTLEDFGKAKAQKMPNPSNGNFLKQFVDIGTRRGISSQILRYYQDLPTSQP